MIFEQSGQTLAALSDCLEEVAFDPAFCLGVPNTCLTSLNSSLAAELIKP